ncbi:hypothetical protein B0H13DRAFT_1865685 [Mycena leptocephala]|nr:hypothetical protein B0H13DRAFT_1865685 [Mycena leptocephala]
MSSLADFPQDVFLEIAKQLDVGDLLNFLAICRPVRELRFQRSLWLDALERIRTVEMHSTSLPNWVPIDTVPLQELQDAVRRAGRLLPNFQSSTPRPVTIRTLSMGSMTRIFCIPGSNLVVAHTTGWVHCWDILTSRRVASLGIPQLHVRSEAPCMELSGKALIAACIGNVDNLVAIRIDCRDRAHISISHVISPPLGHAYTLRGGFFINAEVLGLCTHSHVFSWSMNAGSMKPHCLPFGRSLYAFHEGSVVTDATVQRLPLTLSNHQPDAHHSGSNITTLNIPYSFASSQRELRSVLGYISRMNSHIPHLFVPNYGICAVTCRSFTWEDIEITAIHFWPGSIVDGSLAFGQGCFYEHRDPINQIAVGASGTYVLLLVLEGDGYLGLLHFIATPFPHTTFRKLDIGDLSAWSSPRIIRGQLLLFLIHERGFSVGHGRATVDIPPPLPTRSTKIPYTSGIYSEPRTVLGIAEQGGRGMSVSSHTYFALCVVHELYVSGGSFGSQSIFSSLQAIQWFACHKMTQMPQWILFFRTAPIFR